MSKPTIPPPPPPAPATGASAGPSESGEKPWYRRWWGITLLIIGLFVIMAVLTDDDSSDTADDDAEPGNEVTAADAEDAEDTPVEDVDPNTSEVATEEAPEADDDLADEEPSEPDEPQPAEYEIISVEDTGLERIDARVVVEGAPDAETLIETAHAAVLQLREADPYTAAFAFLFAEGDRTEDSYTLARAVDAPNGELGDAVGATAGEYGDHIVTIDAREKDWATQPSDGDNEIAAAWFPLNHDLYDEVDFDEVDEETDRRVAADLGVSESEVSEAIDRVAAWGFSGDETTVTR